MSDAVAVDDYSLSSLHYIAKFGDTPLALGTCFFYRHAAGLYLITNWHNVTGRHPATLQLLDTRSGGIPDRFQIDVHQKGALGRWRQVLARLYLDEERERPRWLVHPQHGRQVDAVAIGVNVDDHTECFPINALESQRDMTTSIGEDVFVIGFPKGVTGGGLLPIWKRASVASEPNLDRDGLPSFLIDTATREGMSGAPVIARSNSGSYRTASGATVMSMAGPGVGRPTKFLGVCSGRLPGQSEIEAQLGIVWKARVIDEIVDGGRLGQPSDCG
jgi:hypothetical protein